MSLFLYIWSTPFISFPIVYYVTFKSFYLKKLYFYICRWFLGSSYRLFILRSEHSPRHWIWCVWQSAVNDQVLLSTMRQVFRVREGSRTT